jgi:hypothetical protein
MPGVSPMKIAFHPSSSWASGMSMPNVERTSAKNCAASISPLS